MQNEIEVFLRSASAYLDALTRRVDAQIAAHEAAPKAEAPKVEAPKVEAPKVEAPKAEAPKAEAPKVEAPKPVVSPAPAPVAAPAPAPAPAGGDDDVMQECVALAMRLLKGGNTNGLSASLSKVGAPRVSSCPPDKLPRLRELLAAEMAAG